MSPVQTCQAPQCHPAASAPSRRASLSSSSWPGRGHLLLRDLAALVGVGSQGLQEVEGVVVDNQGLQEVEVVVVDNQGGQEVEVVVVGSQGGQEVEGEP